MILCFSYRKLPGNKCTGGFEPKRSDVKIGDVCKFNSKAAITEDLTPPAEVSLNKSKWERHVVQFGYFV